MKIKLYKLLTIISLIYFNVSYSATWYVDDNSDLNDVYTIGSAAGNDAASGTTSAPFKTLKHAISVAVSGDIIIVDAGFFDGAASGSDYGINVTVDNITVQGVGMGLTIFDSNKNKGTMLTITANNF